MSLQPINFVKTTLRAPCGVGDTQLQLASGTGALFNPITAGNWCYVTVNDSTSVEVMKYTSAGNVVNDTITVERAQDDTTAKAFPVGACVAIGWNVAQILGLIDGIVTNPVDTIQVSSTPVGAPAAHVVYAVNPSTGQLWYWTGSVWTYVNSNSVQLLTSAPSVAPLGNIRWTINTTTSSLYYWTGLTWLLIAGGGGSNYLEIFGWQYLTLGGGTAIAVGTDNPFSGLITGGLPVTIVTAYKSNMAVTDVISVQPNNVLRFLVPCIVELSASIEGDMDDITHDFRGQLSIFHSTDTYEWFTQTSLPANSGSTTVGISVNTGPVEIVANDEFDANLVTIDGGGTFVGFNLKKLRFSASVIALL